MKKEDAQRLLNEFEGSEQLQRKVSGAIDYLAQLCVANALVRGFHDDEEMARLCLEHGLFERFADYEKPMDPRQEEIEQWFEATVLQAELARQASEVVGEGVEAARKPGPDHHCPEFSNFLIEEADGVIRIGDTCGKRNMPLGDAVVAKLLFNMSRPYKHGKNS